MTAMSAQRASGNAANGTKPFATAHIRIPGSLRTYEVRDVLSRMGLQWGPLSYPWHGKLPGDHGSRLFRDLGLERQIVPTIEAFATEGVPQPRETSRQGQSRQLRLPGGPDHTTGPVRVQRPVWRSRGLMTTPTRSP
jgi:hypothetical protein